MYKYFDIHAHSTANASCGDLLTILNFRAPDRQFNNAAAFSYGIHPYDVAMAQESWLETDFASLSLLAIGEIGLDFRYESTTRQQIAWFKKQLDIATAFRKPVIIHCVKAIPQTLQILESHNCNAYVFHGFNSSTNNAMQIIENGGYLSFGPQIITNPSLQKTLQTALNNWPDRILFETDESQILISSVYQTAVHITSQPLDELQKQILKNFNSFFSTSYDYSLA